MRGGGKICGVHGEPVACAKMYLYGREGALHTDKFGNVCGSVTFPAPNSYLGVNLRLRCGDAE